MSKPRTTKRISGRPPEPKNLDEKMEAFILGDDVEQNGDQSPKESSTELFPWEANHVRDDVIKSINLRLPEPYILKLKYLSEQTNISQQKLIRDILCPVIDQHINNIN